MGTGYGVLGQEFLQNSLIRSYMQDNAKGIMIMLDKSKGKTQDDVAQVR